MSAFDRQIAKQRAEDAPSVDVLAYRGNTHNASGQECVASYKHRQALRTVHIGGNGQFADALKAMLSGWAAYASTHAERYGDVIANDGILGEVWLDIGKTLHKLLDGETGGLDCGSLSQNIGDVLRANGFEQGLDA